MAKLELNALFYALHGTIGDLVLVREGDNIHVRLITRRSAKRHRPSAQRRGAGFVVAERCIKSDPSAIDVGLALVNIRDRRLYRTEYQTFPEYYRNKWHFDYKKVHFLTATAETCKTITTAANLPRPEYAFQLRPLSGLPPDQARSAWEHAAEKAVKEVVKITERLVRASVVELKLKPEADAGRTKHREERGERRRQLTQTMTELLELIVMRKSYEELVQKASLLDQHVRFFFPKRRKQSR